MRIKWFGHASFLIETAGQKILTDPFDEKLGYPLPDIKPDIVTVSHEHWDHNAVGILKGKPRIIKGTGKFEFEDIIIEGIPSFHDKEGGKERGTNTIYKISSEEMTLVHLGDLGHLLNKEQLTAVESADVLLVPVGGTFTIDAREAQELVENINPGIVIPMHFNTAHLSFDLAEVEEFTTRYEKVVKKHVVDIKKDELEKEVKIIVLDYL